ncbi:hypothetical protein [Aliiglaciecola sp. LCG003]|uniref:hypothetical protein n=1 Tax=Aliiglaciecola sp. LCG003 TaxID=3053655 RepID=UPI002572FA54|nr:hypothetical protein [Aliiglaciecola sp. LCG003]WJG10087.1 hypothetical protein QR722_03340 [Aliiglaciecola sp. LCG003]
MPETLNSAYTESVIALVNSIDDKKVNSGSLYSDAKAFFSTYEQEKKEFVRLKTQIDLLEQEIASGKPSKEAQNRLFALTKKRDRLIDQQDAARHKRMDRVSTVCLQLLSLSEGKNHSETLLRSAKFLGTLLLLSSGEGKQLAEHHQQLKHAYKAVLSLRFLEELMYKGNIRHKFILTYWDAEQRFLLEDFVSADFNQAVVLPILLTTLFQDIGMQHPEVVSLLMRDGNKDPFRILDIDERSEMLRLNYRYTLLYLTEGLGGQNYKGNSKADRDDFVAVEKERLRFQKSLLNDANTAKKDIGDIIKVPQIYTSIVLSTKPGYKRHDLPKAAVLVEQLAHKNNINQKLADAFVGLVGYFPQGYGVCYLPTGLVGNKSYEYAVVNQLKPINKYEPNCRIVSKNQIFISGGSNVQAAKHQNLHFGETRKKLAPITQERLTEIMGSLAHEYDVDKADRPVPSMWEPHDFFTNKGIQNLWPRVE